MTNKIDPSRDVELPTIKWTPQPWRERAACKQLPIDLFFVSVGDDVTFAKSICNGCPVRRECLVWACKEQISHGIFGGLSPRERRNFRKGIVNWEICGTPAGVRAHDDKQEPLCPACTSARKESERKARNRHNHRQRQQEANRAQT